jgi:hypothetical protein
MSNFFDRSGKVKKKHPWGSNLYIPNINSILHSGDGLTCSYKSKIMLQRDWSILVQMLEQNSEIQVFYEEHFSDLMRCLPSDYSFPGKRRK